MFEDNPTPTKLIVSIAFGLLVFILAATWAVQGNDFFIYKVFAAKQEDARRETFEHSKAFIDGNIQELRSAQLDYGKAKDKDEKRAIRAIILRRLDSMDQSKLPPDLASFVDQLRSQP